MIFHNRQHAGQLLAEKLEKYENQDCIVLALPRGGVPIGAQIAKSLNAPLDVLVVRKIGAPFQSELAVGALCEDSEPLWNDSLLFQLGLEPDDLNRTVGVEKEKIHRQIGLFRGLRKFPTLTKKTVIVVDDGLATGATMSAAIRFLKRKAVAKIIVALPVAAASSAALLRRKVDEVLILEEREDLMSVGQWYEDFSQVTDEEVISLLQKQQGEQLEQREIEIPVGKIRLKGDLTTLSGMKALIIFAHGSGSGRKSPRNQQVAQYLNDKGFGTLLFDLLTDEEAKDRKNVFDIDFLSHRLALVSEWLYTQPYLKDIAFGYFGASTGAGAAIQAASEVRGKVPIYAIVSRGGRPDLAGKALKVVTSPTLLLVGGQDFDVIELNQQAKDQLENCELSIVPGATHLFEESGTLEEVAKQAAEWFNKQLPVDKIGAQPKIDSLTKEAKI